MCCCSCSCSVSAIDIKSMAKQGQVLSTANIQDFRDKERYLDWRSVVEKVRISDCVVFNDKNQAQNFYSSSWRAGIRVARYQDEDVITFTRYE